MAYTIPADTKAAGNTGFLADINNAYDMLGLLTRAVAQIAGGGGAADPGGNVTNVAAIQSFISSGLMVASHTTFSNVFQLVDSSLLVVPKASGDDATSINHALSLLTAPGTPGPTTARLSGATYNIQSTIGGSNWTYGTWLDLNASTLNWNGSANSDCISIHGTESGGYTQLYRAGGVYNGSIVSTGTAAGCCGLRYGAGEGFGIRDIRVHGFSDASNGSYGIIQDNTHGWTEKTRLHNCEITQCDNGFYIFTPSAGTYTSHEYNTWDLWIRGFKSQNLMVMSGNGAFCSGSELHLKGNCGEQAHPSGATGTASVLDLSAGANMNKCLIYIQVESTGTGAFNWTTIKFGGSGSGASMVDSMGMIRIIDGNFNLSDAVAAQFSFGGMITEDNVGATQGLKNINSKPQGWL